MAEKKAVFSSLDALVKKTLTKTSSLDAIVGYWKTTSLDALVGFSETSDLDAYLLKSYPKTLSLDSYLLKSNRIPAGSVAWNYTGQVGSIAIGDYAIGQSSGARGILTGIIDNGATGTLFFDSISDPGFTPGETLIRGIRYSERIVNGSMEEDSSWASYGSINSNTRSSSRAHSGTYSRYVYESASPDVGIQSTAFTTVTGATYTLTMWFNDDYGDPINIRILSGDGSVHSNNAFQPPSTDTWTSHSIEYEETAGGSSAQVLFLTPSTNAGSWIYYIDDVSCTGFLEDPATYMTASGSA